MYLYDVQLMLTAWAVTFLCSLLVLETFYFDTISLHFKLNHIFIICYMPVDSSALKLLYSSSCPSQGTFPSSSPFPPVPPPLPKNMDRVIPADSNLQSPLTVI